MLAVVEALPPLEVTPCPVTVRIGLLGLGNVGSAFARLARGARDSLRECGVVARTTAALVRSSERHRPAADAVDIVTADPGLFFAQPFDVVVEVLGGVEPAYSFVRRALDGRVPVVTANKSLIAAHGEALSVLARQRHTALRYEASCIAGVPFLGTFERRPFASRVRGLTAVLNGTSNAILTAMSDGIPFETALGNTQRRGLAEPDSTSDVSGRDAAEKLTLLIRRFAQLLIDPGDLYTEAITVLDPLDLRAARSLGGTLKPVAQASWSDGSLQAFVGPAYLPDRHPLAEVHGATNGILLDGATGRQCYIGPGAGPDVTAITLLDDVCELASEERVRTPSATVARHVTPRRPAEAAWFLRLAGDRTIQETSELLGAYGVWCARTVSVERRVYALTMAVSAERVQAAAEAMHAATGCRILTIPALSAEAFEC
jgi:homoserine dehydrogenase